MQGRLSPSLDGRFQFFPPTWEDEFSIAREHGFDSIDWFLDVDVPNFDPILDVWATPEIVEKIDRVRKILSIGSIDCGCYGTFGPAGVRTRRDFPVLLTALAPRLTSTIVSIPLVEKFAPHTEEEKKESQATIRELETQAQALGLRIALETEMPAPELLSFVSACGPNVGVCYDLGNAASYGVDIPAEIRQLGNAITLVHIKDRVLGGASTLLGKGAVPFGESFKALKDVGYHGQFTLQAWRGAEYLNNADTQRTFVKNLIASHL